MVPSGWFDIWLRAIDAASAAEQLASAHATAHGEWMARAGNDPALRQYTRRLERRAYPVIHTPEEGGPDGR